MGADSSFEERKKYSIARHENTSILESLQKIHVFFEGGASSHGNEGLSSEYFFKILHRGAFEDTPGVEHRMTEAQKGIFRGVSQKGKAVENFLPQSLSQGAQLRHRFGLPRMHNEVKVFGGENSHGDQGPEKGLVEKSMPIFHEEADTAPLGKSLKNRGAGEGKEESLQGGLHHQHCQGLLRQGPKDPEKIGRVPQAKKKVHRGLRPFEVEIFVLLEKRRFPQPFYPMPRGCFFKKRLRELASKNFIQMFSEFPRKARLCFCQGDKVFLK